VGRSFPSECFLLVTGFTTVVQYHVSGLMIGPIPWGHSGPLCHPLSSLSSFSWTSMRRRRATVATPGERHVKRLAVANGPNIFQMLLVLSCTAVHNLS